MNSNLMKKMWLSLILLLIMLTGLAGWVLADPARALNSLLPEHRYQRVSLTYGEHPRHQMDIYLPSDDSPRQKKLVVFIQGGAWRYGERQDYEFIGHAITELGYTLVVPDYRLFPEVRFPDFVEDVASALRVLVSDHSRVLPGDLDGLVLMGHSAGAHLAALMMTEPEYLATVTTELPLRGLIGLAGPYDLPLDDPEVTPVFAGQPAGRVNPIRQLQAGTPPVLLIHGEADERVGPHHTHRFAARLRALDCPVQTRFYQQTGHRMVVASIAAPLRFINPVFRDIQNFLAGL